MTVLAHRGEGPAFSYAGQPMHILAGHGGQPPGFAAMELTVPPHFAGPLPHAHDEFDEAIYVLSGRLLVVGEDAPQEAAPGSMFVASRGYAGHPARPGPYARDLRPARQPSPALISRRSAARHLREHEARLRRNLPIYCPGNDSAIELTALAAA